MEESYDCRGSKPAHHSRRGCRRHPPSPGQHAQMFELDDDALYDEGSPPLPRKCLRVRSLVRRVVETEPDDALEQCCDCDQVFKSGDLCDAGCCRDCCGGLSCWPNYTQGIQAGATAEAPAPRDVSHGKSPRDALTAQACHVAA